ncbi:MAG TPA: LPXTG cell wall anchor domain-containing protein [Ilumatobacteraceae bacterium]|nr:LPXTG cell wall anchor domain-containing protein [Ilumatobacteraceae bacterium]
MKLSQLIVAAGIAVGGLVGFGGIASAAPTASTSAVACVNGDGVMDLVVSNPATDASAEFVVTNPQTFIASVIDLAPGSSQVVTVDGLADGSVVVPVQFNGSDASVSTQISCDAPTCAQGAPTTVTDDSGVQHQACVDSAADPVAAPPAVASTQSSASQSSPSRSSLSQSAATTGSTQLPKTGAGTGGLVIAALLVGSGSVASLLSRRKPDRRR